MDKIVNKNGLSQAHFRAKDENDKWVYGVPLKKGDDVVMISSSIFDSDLDDSFIINKIKEETICRFTGFKINGQPIYQGDIVEITIVDEDITYRDYIDFANSCMTAYSPDNEYDYEPFEVLYHSDDEWEIIGNVFDNLNLLEESNDKK